METMKTTESCRYCEKVLVELVSPTPIASLLDVPNTFDASRREYSWKIYDSAAYALVPRAIAKTSAELDVFVCMEEDDLDDIDLLEFVKEVVVRELASWKTSLRITRVTDSLLAPPAELQCYRQRHSYSNEP